MFRKSQEFLFFHSYRHRVLVLQQCVQSFRYFNSLAIHISLSNVDLVCSKQALVFERPSYIVKFLENF